MTSNNNKKVPDWSLQVTEQLLSPSSSPMIVHENNNKKDEQFQDYIDRHFTGTDAKILKNRISDTPSKATTLRNSTSLPNKNNWNDLEKPPLPQLEQEQPPWWVAKDDQDGFYSIGGILFLFGFICPPCWWIGSFWPKNVKEKGGKLADRWQKLNRIMSIGFSTVLIILIIVFAVLYTRK
jgi:hypothetical protein